MEEEKGGGELFTECLLGAGYFVSASPRLPHLILTTTLKEVLLFPFHQWGNWETGKLHDLSMDP